MGRPISLKFSFRSAGESEDGDTIEDNITSEEKPEDGNTIEDNNTSEGKPAEWLIFLHLLVGRSDYRSLLQFWISTAIKKWRCNRVYQ